MSKQHGNAANADMSHMHGYQSAVDDKKSSDLQMSKSAMRAAHLTQSSADKDKKSAGAFRTISEVADILGVQQHVLRFWETKFTQVKPLKRGGGRRYYRPEDIRVLQHIHHLLYSQGFTIKGVQKLLRGHGKTQVANGEFKKEIALQEAEITSQADANSLSHSNYSDLANQASSNQPVQAPAPESSQYLAPSDPAAQMTDALDQMVSAHQNKTLSDRQRSILTAMVGELKELRDMIKVKD